MTTTSPPHRDHPTAAPVEQDAVRAALTAVLDGARDLVGAPRAAVLLRDPDGSLRSAARRGYTAAAARSLAQVLRDGEVADALMQGRTITSRAADGCVPLSRWAAEHHEPEIVVAPLSPPRGRTGALVMGFDQAGDAARNRLAERLASLAGLALAGAPPGDGAPQTQAGAGSGATRLAEALAEALVATASATTLADAGRSTADAILRSLPGTDIVNVWMLDEEHGSLERVAEAGSPDVIAASHTRLPLDERVGAVRAMRSGQIAVWQGAHGGWPDWLRDFADRAGLATVVHAPMQSGGRTTGAITVGSRTSREYHPEVLTFLSILAHHLGGQLDVVRGRARAEEERQRLSSLLDTLPEGLMMVRTDGLVGLYNQAAVDILGEAPRDVPVERRAQAYSLRTADGRPLAPPEIPVARALRGETVRAAELLMRRADGTDLPLLVSAGPVRDADGSVVAAVLVFQDISRLKELDRLKDDFINTVSHELRTPTTTIRGGALTLLKRADRLDAETRRQLLQDIAEESERLHHLVEDLLSLSRSQAGMRMAPEPLRLHRAVNRVILDLGVRVGSHTLTVDVPADLPVIEADPVALDQILRNLIENGVQHSPRGGRVEVTAHVRDSEVVVGVLDRGPGIPDGDLDRVFEPFYRAAATVASGAQGAGLGLAVCRRLVEMHGGRIWAENRSGGGAAFRFTLPLAPDEDE
jgi:PAS domain S-box-containing protein